MAAVVEDRNKDIFSSMARKRVMRQGPRKPEEEARIDKVSDKIRKEDPEAYDPQIVSIGPIHHGKPKLLPMEDIKWQFLNSLILRHESNSLENYINAVSIPSRVQQIAECYSEQVVGAHGRDTFVEMMVLDGCFIIEYLLKSSRWEPVGKLDFVDWNNELVKNDLLLIENQIPFSVLQVLYDSCCFHPDLPTPIAKLVMNCFSLDGRARIIDYPGTRIPVPRVIRHLLHLHHSWLRETPTVTVKQEVTTNTKPIILRSSGPTVSLFPCPWRWRVPYEGFSVPKTTFSAAEIYAAGIIFESNKKASLDLTFIASDGVMKIPVLTVKSTTMYQFRNLLALEQYLPDIGSPVTSYVLLMNSLIDTPADVAILEKCRVLKSKLNGNEELVRFFRTLSKSVYRDNNHDHLVLLGLLKNVNHCCAAAGQRNRWWERIRQVYLRHPLSLSTFFTFIALYISLLQTFVAALNYDRHLKSN